MTAINFIPASVNGLGFPPSLFCLVGGVFPLSSAPRPVAHEEAAIIRRVLEGDNSLFYELVRPYERAVFVAAMSVVHNEHDAEEVAQEAVLKAFVNLKTFRAESKFSTWLI